MKITGKAYNYLGNIIDNKVGYSVGKAVYNNTSQIINRASNHYKINYNH